MKKILFIFSLLVLSAGLIYSQTTINVPADYTTIQAAINAANDGDIIQIATGTYVENNFGWTGLQVQNKSIQIIGAGSAATKVQVGPLTTGIGFLNSGSPMSIWLEGLTFEPDGATGPGFFIRIGETGGVFNAITMKDVIVSKAEGRNVFFETSGTYSNILVENCEFADAKYWGFSFNWLTTTAQNVTFTNSKFLRNGINGDMNSTGLEIINVNNLIIDGCTFNRNRAKGLNLKDVTNATISKSSWWRNGESATTPGTPNTSLAINQRSGIIIWEDAGTSSNIDLVDCSISETYGAGIILGTNSGTNTVDDFKGTGCFFNDNKDDGGNYYQNVLIWKAGGDLTNIAFNKCSFANGYIYDNISNAVDLSCNWWGTTSESQIQNRAMGTVNDYSPWLNVGTDMSGDPGFQPDLSTLWVSAASPQVGSSGRIQEAVGYSSGGTINVLAGTYVEPVQIDINKNVTLLGADKSTTIVQPGFNTGSGNNKNSAFIYIDNSATAVMKNFTVDCAGRTVYEAVQSRGALDIEDCIIQNVKWGTYIGRGIVYFSGTTNNLVKNVSMNNIERIGVHVRGAVINPAPVVDIQNFTYTGKGVGDWLDYGIEFGGGGSGTVDGSTISNCKGIALSDGSTSGAILATTYFGAGTSATITNSTLTNNTTGIVVGYDASDVSTIVAHFNDLSNNDYGVTSTGPLVNAELNWWGTAVESEIQAMISGNVDYDPWIGKGETVNVTQISTVYNFTIGGIKMEFNTLPSGGGNVTVVRHNQAYTPFPGSYTNLGLWLDITSGMPNYSFNAEVTVDVSAIAGFNASTSVMYYNSSSSKWVAIPGGTYNGTEHTFTFTTNHFTPFTFINTPATAYDIYLSSGTSASAGLIYPNTDWSITSYEPDDWDFTAPISLYIVPEVGSEFGASDITIQWDNTMFSFDDVDESGGIYDGSAFQFFFSQLGTTDQVTINASRLDNQNFTIASDQYIAKLNLNLLKPGFGPVNFTALDFRAFDGNGGFEGVYVTGNNAAVKSYLGDVASSSVTTTGDGLVDINDLNLWAGSYWSGVGPNNLDNYKVKYDVGPTTDNTVYGLPVPDQKIQFEDLVIFSMSYGLSADQVYPKISVPAEPVELQLGKPVISGNQTRIPLFVSGGVVNLRAMSLIFGGQFGKLVSVEKGAILNQFTNPVMLMNKTEDGQVYVDLAVMGAYETGICSEGEVLTLVFEGNAALNISSADLRNMLNKPMEINISAGKEVVPSEYALLQNYPNPFNPVTTINYEIPMQSMVEINIYNALGEKVAVLVNEMKEAGRYNVEFNAAGYSSGIYIYQIKANDYVSGKKMILMK